MKRNVILSSVAVAVLLFSGCSTNKPTVDQTAKTITTPSLESSSMNTGNTTSSDTTTAQNATDNVAASSTSMADIEKSMTSVYFDFDKFNIQLHLAAV